MILVLYVVSLVFYWWNQTTNFQYSLKSGKKLKYFSFVHRMWNKNDNLRTMKRVFDRLGHEKVNGIDDDWDVLWSIEHPKTFFPKKLSSLEPHQRVNHFPGIDYITDKKWMATKNRFDFIPKAFSFPQMKEEFEEYLNENPESKFVVKDFDNRGVKIVSIDEINFINSNETFYQKFVENPMLIDDRAFDLGVYVLITSIDPLRIYRMNEEILMRFCPEPYHPFDPKNVDKYVIQESRKTIFEMPSLMDYVTTLEMSLKASLDVYLNSRGLHPENLWSQIDNAIVTLVIANEKWMIHESNLFAPSAHFFELVRFDFIIDNDFKVHLMEVNMSPNLTPAEDDFENYAPSFERVVYNSLKCAIGIDSDENFR